MDQRGSGDMVVVKYARLTNEVKSFTDLIRTGYSG
jgi:hypothetical protein